MPRRLLVLDFEDFRKSRDAVRQEANLRVQYGACVDVSVVRSWKAAQERLLNSPTPGADILLLDVMGEQDATVDGPPDRWPLVGGQDLRPFIPMLALPYIGMRDLVAMVPWSANWRRLLDDPEPMIWVALGLILSKYRGRVLEWSQVSDEIRAVHAYTSVTMAIEPAVAEYRRMLERAIMNNEVSVLPGATQLVGRLTQLRDQAVNSPSGTCPLATEELVVRLQFPSGRDEVFLESLFGDLLEWLRGPVSVGTYDDLIEWFDDKVLFEAEYEAAVRALDMIPEMTEPFPEAGHPAPAVVAALGQPQPLPNPREFATREAVKRRNRRTYPNAVLLVANEYDLEESDLHSLEVSRSSKTAKTLSGDMQDVLLAFGSSLKGGARHRVARLSVEDFVVLFENIGARREQALDRAIKRAVGTSHSADTHYVVKKLCVILAHVKAYNAHGGTLRDKVMHALGFVDDNSYRDLFEPRSARAVHRRKWLQPFDDRESDPKKRFYLHPEAPALDVFMRGLCQEYARHELNWADDDQWPEWMR